jgi:stage III sporulation protein AH
MKEETAMANMKGKNDTWVQMVRRNSVVAAVVLFVCVAVYLNWNYQNGEQTDAGKTLGDAALVAGEANDPLLNGAVTEGEQGNDTTSSYFANARLNRQQARDSALSLLQEASANAQADQVMREQTNAAIQTMADFTVTEAQIENLVVAKGYTDCVTFIGEDTVSVVVQVPGGQLTDVDTARIKDIVTQTTEFTASQIKIIDAP